MAIRVDYTSTDKHYITSYLAPAKWEFQKQVNEKDLVDYAVTGDSLNITKAVRKWIADPSTNNGLMFKAYDESVKALSKIDLLNDTKKPFLTIEYRTMVGLESYWPVHTIMGGTSGDTYINNYTGNLTLQNNIASTTGIRLPAKVSFIYNANEAAQGKKNAGWRMNLQENIKIPIDTVDDISVYPYVYTDPDGTTHYFKAKNVRIRENIHRDTTTNIEKGVKRTKAITDTNPYPAAEDEDGLKLYIVPVVDKTLKNKYCLKLMDQSGSMVKYFDRNGNLGMIVDSNQNENLVNTTKKVQNAITVSYDTISLEKYNFGTELQSVISTQYTNLVTAAKDKNFTAEAANTYLQKVRDELERFKTVSYVQSNYKIALKYQEMKNKLDTAQYDKTNVADKKKILKEINDSTKATLNLINKCNSTTGYSFGEYRVSKVADAVGSTNNDSHHVITISYGKSAAGANTIEVSDPTTKDGKHRLFINDAGEVKRIIFSIIHSNFRNVSLAYFLDSTIVKALT